MAVSQTVPIHRLTFEDVLAMVEAGVLEETARVELEQGVLVEMVPIGGQHAGRVEWLTRHLVHTVPNGLAVRVQDTFLIPDGGYYEPDLMVIDRLGAALPRTAALVVEVAVSSRARDEEKAATYAAAGVSAYWILDTAAREVVVHTGPEEAGYAAVRTARPGERLPTPYAGAGIEVAAMLDG